MNKLNQIKQIADEFFQQMGWEADIQVEISEKIVFLKINTPDSALLIGRGGQTLESLQHILRLLVDRKIDDYVHLIVDVSNYKDRQKNFLEQKSIQDALEVIKTGQEKILEPMNSYERRIVHLALKKIDGITEESQGEGSERRIVIRKIK